jgi:hypothetical protein
MRGCLLTAVCLFADAVSAQTASPWTSVQLTTFPTEVVFKVFEQPDTGAKTVALRELASRKEPAYRSQVRRWFDERFPAGRNSVDAGWAKTPDGMLFVAACEYLASAEGLHALDAILSRAESWSIAPELARAFRLLGPDWVDQLLSQTAGDEERAGNAAVWIARGAARENAHELVAVLRRSDSRAWLAAVQACDRLQLDPCWPEVRRFEADRPLDARIRALTVLARQASAIDGALLALVGRAVADLEDMPFGPARASLASALSEFAAFARSQNIALSPRVAGAIARIGGTR